MWVQIIVVPRPWVGSIRGFSARPSWYGDWSDTLAAGDTALHMISSFITEHHVPLTTASPGLGYPHIYLYSLQLSVLGIPVINLCHMSLLSNRSVQSGCLMHIPPP
jgi:hypothetical protein